MLDLAAEVERHGDRLRRLEEQARQDSRTSSKPPSQDPPKTRQQRRAEARAKAKELLAKDGAGRKAGGRRGIAVRVASSLPRTGSMRSSITTRTRAVAAAVSSARMSAGPGAGSVVIRSPSCRPSACS